MSYDREPASAFRGTTICAVKRGGVTAIAGDGQITMGQSTILKGTARKVRRIYNRPGRHRLCRLGVRRIRAVGKI